MGVHGVTDGPLFPDEGPRSDRLIRRARSIGLETLLFVLITVASPLLVPAAAIVDAARFVTGRRQWMALRLLAMAWWFLLGEMRAYATAAAIALFSRYGSDRRRRWSYSLRVRWMAGHVAGLRTIMGLTFEVEGLEESGPGPVVIFMRHASIIDNSLPDALAARAHGMGLRYVIKRELQSLGAIDIVARWIPTYLAARDSKDTDADVAAVRKLTENFGPDTREGILIYPEGTRFTAERLAKAKKVIAERQPENAERANRLQHILPPKLGGPIAVLEETAPCDVVFCGHAGFDGLRTVGDIWRGKLVGNTIHVRFQRFPGERCARRPRAEGGLAVRALAGGGRLGRAEAGCARPLTGVSEAAVYLLRCADDSLYCGWTNDLDRRLAAHQAGTASRYTRSRLPVELAWSRAMASRSEAMSEEARIKRLPRAAKDALVRGEHPSARA